MRQFLISAVMLLLAISANGQFQIKGKVIDENGNPLVGATVFIRSESIGSSTDKLGKFTFTGLSKSTNTLNVSFIGYSTETVQVSTENEVHIQLKIKATNINELTVTSVRANKNSAVAYQDVNKEDIEKLNLGQDIPYLLALTPSFVTNSDAGTGIGYTGFRIRGTDANRTNITLNGVPLNDAESHGTFFVNMPDFASSLSSIQVQRGVGTSTNGAAAFGASINMQTEGVNAKPYGEISSTLGSFNTKKNTLKVGTGLMENGFAFDARLSNVKSDGYVDRAWVDMKSYYFSAAHYGDKSTIKFLTFGGDEKTYQAWYGVISDSITTNRTYNEAGIYYDNNGKEQFYDNQTDNYKQTHYQLHWLQEINSNLHFNLTTHLTRGIGYYEEYKEGRKYKEYGLTPDTIAGITIKKTDLVRQKWLDNYFYGIIYALNYDTKKINASIGGAINRYDGDHYGKIIWVRNSNNLNINKLWYKSSSVKDDANIYAKVSTELLSGLYLSTDLQYRYISYSMNGTDDKYDDANTSMRNITTAEPYQYHFFNPKFGLTYLIDKNQYIYASYSISNREPNRNNYTERASTEAQPTFETLFDTEAGYHFQSKTFSAAANLYFMNYKNQLTLTGKRSEIGEMLTTNTPESYRGGIEISAGVKITDWLKWDVNATFSQNKINNFIENIPVYDANYEIAYYAIDNIGKTDIAFSPSIIANNILSVNINQFECGLYSNFVNRQYLDNTSTQIRSIDPYFVNNLSFKYSLAIKEIKSIDFQILVNNIFDNKYETNGWAGSEYYEGDPTRYDYVGFFPQAGTNFLASVTIKF